jgi:hypothetical protein
MILVLFLFLQLLPEENNEKPLARNQFQKNYLARYKRDGDKGLVL